jgi:hypothetical protein
MIHYIRIIQHMIYYVCMYSTAVERHRIVPWTCVSLQRANRQRQKGTITRRIQIVLRKTNRQEGTITRRMHTVLRASSGGTTPATRIKQIDRGIKQIDRGNSKHRCISTGSLKRVYTTLTFSFLGPPCLNLRNIQAPWIQSTHGCLCRSAGASWHNRPSIDTAS